MKKIRTAIAVFATVFALGIAGAPPAQATIRAERCFTNQFAGLSARMCVAVNEHSQYHWLEGYLGMSQNSGLAVWVDFVRIYRGQNLIDANTYPSWYSAPQSFTTDWATNCLSPGSWSAKARYRFKRISDGAISGWFTNSSGTFNHPGACF